MRERLGTPARVCALTLLAGVAFPLGAPAPARAQDVRSQPGIVVFSQNICPYENVPRLTAMVDSLFTPVLDEFVTEKKLIGWALLSNWWGDEWNWNLSYTAANYEAFLDFWNDYVGRLNAGWPGWNDEMSALCTEHKDTFYTVVRANRGDSAEVSAAGARGVPKP